MSSVKQQLIFGQESLEVDSMQQIDSKKASTLEENQQGGSGGGKQVMKSSAVDTSKCSNKENESSEGCKEDDEDKKNILAMIAMKNSKFPEEQETTEQSENNQSSQIHISRVQSRTNESSQHQLQQQSEGQIINVNQLPSLNNLERKRYISTEIDQQSLNNNNNNNNNTTVTNNTTQNNNKDNDTFMSQLMNMKSKYSSRAAALGQGQTTSSNTNTNFNGENSQQQPATTTTTTENQQNQIGFQGLNQQAQYKNAPMRSQIQYQSGLSSSCSLTVQRDFFIYFSLQSSNNSNSRSGSSNYESSYEHEEESLINTQGSMEPIRVPIEEILEDTIVSDAINSAICQINNIFSTQKIHFRLVYDENLFELFLAKKNGEKKSFPALYPLEKMKKFNNSNFVLIPKDPSAIKRPQKMSSLGGTPQKTKSIINRNTLNPNEPKHNNRDIIKEVSESMISNKSYEVTPAIMSNANGNATNTNGRNGSSTASFLKNKNSSSFTGYPSNPNTRRSIQSTITPKQTKIGTEEREEAPVQSPSKCFPFGCCMGGNSYSKTSTKNANATQSGSSSKKRSTVVSN